MVILLLRHCCLVVVLHWHPFQRSQAPWSTVLCNQ